LLQIIEVICKRGFQTHAVRLIESTMLFKVENILEKFDSLHCNPFRLPGAKFGICTDVGLNGTLVEAKIHTWNT
jgi:hypothetical protein